MFIRLYELAETKNNADLRKFCRDILSVYDQHGINGHIKWDK